MILECPNRQHVIDRTLVKFCYLESNLFHQTNHSPSKFQNTLLYKSCIYYRLYIYIYKFHAIFSPLFQIIVDGRDKNAVDIDGQRLPTLVYMAREKRHQWPHNFKAGAMNALVSFQLKFVHWLSSSYVRYNFFSLSHHSITFY